MIFSEFDMLYNMVLTGIRTCKGCNGHFSRPARDSKVAA